MLFATIAQLSPLPGWLTTPGWLLPAARAIGHFVHDHQAVGLFGVIFSEELGIPLPAPGDAAITYAGYLTTRNEMAMWAAFLAVVAGATTGSFCLYQLSRRFGHPFLVRFGPYVGLTAERLAAAERAFQRWGPWAIIVGRHIPGMRIVLSAFAGVFEVSARVFVVCVLVSSTLWAAIFIEVGRVLGRNSRLLFRVVPAHLFPLAIVAIVIAYGAWLAFDHRRRHKVEARKRAEARGGLPPKAESRTAKM